MEEVTEASRADNTDDFVVREGDKGLSLHGDVVVGFKFGIINYWGMAWYLRV